MTQVALLNSGAADAKAATEMVANLRKRVHDTERRLTEQRMGSYDEYIGVFAQLQAFRHALQDAETTYGRHFKI
jgi:hypothetical protein